MAITGCQEIDGLGLPSDNDDGGGLFSWAEFLTAFAAIRLDDHSTKNFAGTIIILNKENNLIFHVR